MNQTQWSALLNEFDTDPDAVGYAAMYAAMPTYTKELTQAEYDALPNQAMRDAYDAERAAWAAAYAVQNPLFMAALNAPVPADDVTQLSASQIFEAIEQTDYDALDAAAQNRIELILKLGDNIEVGPGSKARAWLVAAFGAGTTTRDNLLSLVTNQTQPRWQALGLSLIKAGWFETLVRRKQRSA